jgi:hypothetical protein
MAPAVEQRGERRRDGLVAAGDVEGEARRARLVQDLGQRRGDVVTAHVAADGLGRQPRAPGGGLVGEGTGADDGPRAVARDQRRVGLRLGAQVDAEDVVAVGRCLGPDGAHHHVTLDPGGLGGLQQLDRPVAVERQLAPRAASGPGPGREDDRVGARDRARHVGDARLLEIEHDRLAAVLTQIGVMVGIADEAAHAVAAGDEQRCQAAGDLPVAACDHDVHRLRLVVGRCRLRGRRRAPGRA